MKSVNCSIYKYMFIRGNMYMSEGQVVLCTQDSSKHIFYGVIVYHEDITVIGEYAAWNGENYIPFTGTIQLNN